MSSSLTYRWTLRDVDRPEAVAQLQRELNDLPEALARALVLRGVESFDDARRFFRPSRAQLHDPFLMADMEAAAERVARAARAGEHVLVYGDYDVDGTTATALMTHFLRRHGAAADYFVPDRQADGYGLSTAGIDRAAAQGAALIVALDCGITARAEADYARQKGIDLIICDHHTAPATLPDALAVLDPKRPDCAYPFKALSGCGVGFKLMQAVLERLGAPAEEAFEYLDLLALSIASDIVPVYGENRVLLREGLELLRARPRLGLRALAEAASVDLERVTATRIVFTLGPRINAAGRLDHARHAVALMLAEDEATAQTHARTLERLNEERRTIDRATDREARHQAERHMAMRARHAFALYDAGWHQGVIGIVASRISERFHKPTAMLCTGGDGTVKGSVRSIHGLNIYDVLTGCEDLLIQFGGHDFAAGLSLKEEHVPAFRDRFDALVGEAVTPELLRPRIDIDAPLDLRAVGAVEDRFWAVLKQFAPFGPSNARPVFTATNLAVTGSPRTVGRDDRHLKFSVQPLGAAHGESGMDAIGFGMGEHLPTVVQSRRAGHPLELAFSVEENTWRGRTSLQLKARDVRLTEA